MSSEFWKVVKVHSTAPQVTFKSLLAVKKPITAQTLSAKYTNQGTSYAKNISLPLTALKT